MPDDLFKRFRAGTSPDDDSGHDARRAGAIVGENEVLAAIAQLPALSSVVKRILDTVGHENSSAADLEALVRQDMVITGKLLKLVNSPFYGLRHPVSSIVQAVSIIGFSSLKSLVLAASVSSVLSAELTAYGFTEEGLWKNSIATAHLAREVARVSDAGKGAEEEWFTAGLMRDVGMLVLGPFLHRSGARLRRGGRESDILRRERALTAVDHCWVGDRVAEKWLLPKRLRFSIARHHRIPTDASAEDMRELAAVRLAERLAYASRIGVVADHPFDDHIDGTLVHAVGLDGEGFKTLIERVPAVIAGAESALVVGDP
ncbi:MAG TPA: HDOD domain-containing protein [Planctomycetota bacterium]|nr:HDOD domain-containing protein [Planctomycetota bacterium]